MSSRVQPEPTPDAPLGSIEYLERTYIPWPTEGRPWDGEPMARYGVRMVFYFRNGQTPEVRGALLAIIEQYLSAAEQPIRRYGMADDTRYRFPADGEALDLGKLRERVDQPGKSWSINLSAEREEACASHWSLLALSTRGGLSYFVLYFPFTYFAGAQPRTVRTLFQRWCSALKVDHAYGGMGFVLPVDVGDQDAAIGRIGHYAMNFIGLDTDVPSWTSIHCTDGIRCINWLTAIKTPWLDRIGGADTVAAAAGPAIGRLPYEGGTIFVAGASPQIGDVEAGVIPTDFIALGRVLKPLRAAYPTGIFNPPPDYPVPPGYTARYGWGEAKPHQLAAALYAQRWLARFDGD